MAEALYRKYRPQVFEDVVGQQDIERTLKNAVAQGKFAQAYLFTGPRGTGKTTTARLLSKALICENGPTPQPDGTCEECRLIAEGTHPDVYELDAASRTGVENVREEIISRVHFAPTRGRYKVYIIDEVHMLSTAAFNALLKTLEEPPEHVVFILATTDPQKVPETIQSRCQRLDFKRIDTESIVSRLASVCEAEGVAFEREALELVAHRADGGMRNALTGLEQLIAFGDGKVALKDAESMFGGVSAEDLHEVVDALGRRDAATAFLWLANLVESGGDLAAFARVLAERVRNLYVMGLAGAEAALDVGSSERAQLASELPLFPLDRAARVLGVLGDVMRDLKTAPNARLVMEVAFTRLARPEADLTLEALAERIEALEAGRVSNLANPAGANFGFAAGGTASQPASTPLRAGAQVGTGIEAVAGAGAEAGAGTRAGVGTGTGAAAAHPGASVPATAASSSGGAGGRGNGVPASLTSNRAGQTAVSGTSASRFGAAAAQTPSPSGAGAAAVSGGEPFASAFPADAALPAQQSTPAGAAVPSQGAALSAAAVAGLRNPAALQRVWQAVQASLKRVKQSYGVLLIGARPVYDASASRLVIEFPPENTFAFNAAQKPDMQRSLAQVLQQAVGEPVPFCLVQGKRGGGAAGGAGAGAPGGDAVNAGGGSWGTAANAAGAPGGAASGSAGNAAASSQDASAHTAAASVEQPVRPAATHTMPQVSGSAPVENSASRSSAADFAPHYDDVPYDEVPYDEQDIPPWEELEPVPAREASAPAAQAQPAPSSAQPGPVSERGTQTQPNAHAEAPGPATPSNPGTPSDATGSDGTPVSGGTPASGSTSASGTAPVSGIAPATLSASSQPAPAEHPLTLDDVQSILAAGFGEGVEVEQLD